jgi:hypothetical protein
MKENQNGKNPFLTIATWTVILVGCGLVVNVIYTGLSTIFSI